MDILSVLTSAGSTAWTLLFFVIGIAIIVTVHEYGHYIVGRWSGIHAEVFSLGFGPVLYSRIDKRGTRWQIAAFPFGGYVKFLGDSNAASAEDRTTMASLSPQERRHSMPGAPLWARAATVAAGPVFNIVLTIAVFVGLILLTGVPTERVVVGKANPVPFLGQGLQVGDQILALDGIATPDLKTYAKVAAKLPPSAEVTYHLQRDSHEIDLVGPHPFLALVGGVQPKSAAINAGIKAGDVILAADGVAVTAFSQMPPLVEAAGGRPITLKIWRGGEVFDLSLSANRRDLPKADGSFETRWLIGLSAGNLFEPEMRWASPWEAMKLSVENTWFLAKTSLSGLWHVVIGAISSCAISGPIGMAEVMGDAARIGPQAFLQMLAALSLGIGLLNLFPIPVLDGGHLVMYAYEAVMRRKPSEKFLGYVMALGLAVILSFMAFALTNDVLCN
ncbi:MAG: RIP metalloprotease RseP [Cypionkella sp.]|nr:RIP metalloprotease RseP [Cypionkella sp.]